MAPRRNNSQRWRRWQFSLRTLLTLMLAVACFLGGWMANDWYRKRQLAREGYQLISGTYVLDSVPANPESREGEAPAEP